MREWGNRFLGSGWEWCVAHIFSHLLWKNTDVKAMTSLLSLVGHSCMVGLVHKHLEQWCSTFWPCEPDEWRGVSPWTRSHGLNPVWSWRTVLVHECNLACHPCPRWYIWLWSSSVQWIQLCRAILCTGPALHTRSGFSLTLHAGAVWCPGPWHLAHGASHRSGNLMAGKQWQWQCCICFPFSKFLGPWGVWWVRCHDPVHWRLSTTVLEKQIPTWSYHPLVHWYETIPPELEFRAQRMWKINSTGKQCLKHLNSLCQAPALASALMFTFQARRA